MDSREAITMSCEAAGVRPPKKRKVPKNIRDCLAGALKHNYQAIPSSSFFIFLLFIHISQNRNDQFLFHVTRVRFLAPVTKSSSGFQSSESEREAHHFHDWHCHRRDRHEPGLFHVIATCNSAPHHTAKPNFKCSLVCR